MATSFTYRLVRNGLADCRITVDERTAFVRASNRTDALQELLLAVADMAQGEAAAEFVFVDEPGCARWRLARLTANHTRVDIARIDRWPLEQATQAQPMFTATIGTRTLAGQALAAARHILTVEGRSGYLDRWRNHPFPDHAMQRLEDALAG